MRRGRGLADRGLMGRSRRTRGRRPPSLMRSSVKSFFSLPLIHKMSFRCKPSAESSPLAGITLLYGVDAGIAACERHRPNRLSIQRVRWNYLMYVVSGRLVLAAATRGRTFSTSVSFRPAGRLSPCG